MHNPLSTTARRSGTIEQDENNVHQFLDYMATYPNVVVRFHTSDITLGANTDVSYLTEPQSRSRVAGYFFSGSIPSKCARERLNGPIHVNCRIFKEFAAPAAESETMGCFVTGRDVIVLQKHVRRNGPPAAHYTSMHGKYNSRCTCQQ